jgi:hypothetical protein
MRKITCLTAAAMAALMLLPTASADSTRVDDPRGDGSSSREDIDYAVADHHDGRLRHRVWMHAEFETYNPRICILVQTRKNGFRICGPKVYRVRDDQPVGTAKMRRPSARSISFSFAKSQIGSPNEYNWYVAVGSNVPFCPDPPCDITRNVVHKL